MLKIVGVTVLRGLVVNYAYTAAISPYVLKTLPNNFVGSLQP